MEMRDQLAKVIRNVQDVDLAVELVISIVKAHELDRAKAQRSDAARRGHASARTSMQVHADACSQLPAVVVNPDQDPDLSKNSDYCAEPRRPANEDPEEPSPPSEPPVLEFPTVGKAKSWSLTAAHLAEYQAAFSALDVLAHFREARLWCVNNPGKRKTPGGMPRFLQNWLSSAQNKARASPAQGSLVPPSQPSIYRTL